MNEDLIIFGEIVGVISNIPKQIMSWILYFLGSTNYTFNHFCAGVFLRLPHVKEPIALVLGIFVDFIISGIFGVVFYMVFIATGTKYWIMKSIALGCGLFFICFGVLRQLFSPQVIVESPLANLLFFFPNLAFSITACWIIKKYGMVKKEPSD